MASIVKAHSSRRLSDTKTPSCSTGPASQPQVSDDQHESRPINASGHQQELESQFTTLSLIAVGITIGDVWPATAGTIVVALYNGGSPGVLFEFLAACLCYLPVTASLAELASAMPSSSGLYQYSTVASGPKWGRMVGFYTGWWNYFQWLVGSVSMGFVVAQQILGTYAFANPNYTQQSWHVFLVFLAALWSAYAMIMFANRTMPLLHNVGVVLVLGGLIIMITICGAMPGRGGRPPHATSKAVWTDWKNYSGWPDVVAFMCGMLNGAYAVGAPDATIHVAEEIPQPHINVPKAMCIQMISGMITAFAYLLAIMYCITDFDEILNATLPLAAVYKQATRSDSITIGMMVVTLLPLYTCLVGAVLAASRQGWVLARDKATPYPNFIASVHPRWKMPFNSALINCILSTILGCLYLGSSLAFNALVSSYVQLSTTTYMSAIIPLILGGRKYFDPGWFSMRGKIGMIMNILK
ncbi:hypothetical protein G7Z17_g9643 [Cylindrodendrum hubeiense]|uniref:Choline transport protein n=1 Tax=Cylindrodendrum hubeiense TaxID=595255 RepID=A0A9P5H4L5_9HYPO|nr:hypothetical protein G7Z17_g9643 [Cylindrodendrum hubeiense]